MMITEDILAWEVLLLVDIYVFSSGLWLSWKSKHILLYLQNQYLAHNKG